MSTIHEKQTDGDTEIMQQTVFGNNIKIMQWEKNG